MTTKNDKKVKKHYKNYYDHLRGLKVKSYQFLNDEDHVEFTEHLNFKTENYSSKFGNRLMLKPNVLNQNIGVPDKYDERMIPFKISREFFDKDHLVFNIPQGMKVESIPKPINLDTKYRQINQSILGSEYYLALKNYFKNKVNKDTDKIVLVKI